MINESARLMAAELLVQREKRAADAIGAIGKGISGTAKGIWNVTGAGTSAAAKELAQYGTAGKVLGAGVRAAPLVGGVTALDVAAGDPAGKHLKQKLEEFRALRAMQQSVYDPNSGMMY